MTVGVRVGTVQVGGGAPVVVQSMTMTDTADPVSTARQCIELAAQARDLGFELGPAGGALAQAAQLTFGDLEVGADLPLGVAQRFSVAAPAILKRLVCAAQRFHPLALGLGRPQSFDAGQNLGAARQNVLAYI